MLNIVFTQRSVEHTIKIQFFNNSFVNKYVKTLKNVLDKKCNVNAIIFPSQPLKWDQEKINLLSAQLRNTIIEAEKLTNIPYPIPIDSIVFKNKSSEERQLLNFIHRSFTNFYKSGWTSWSGKVRDIPISCDPKVTREVLQEINEGVHRIEPYFYYDNSRYSQLQHKELEFNFSQAPYLELKKEDFTFKSLDSDADIWLPISCMLGKNILSAYLDFDDPAQFDIVNENLYNGDFVFADRSTLITSEMSNWIKSHNGNHYYGLPLGKVVQGKKIFFNILESYCQVYGGQENKFSLKKIFFENKLLI